MADTHMGIPLHTSSRRPQPAGSHWEPLDGDSIPAMVRLLDEIESEVISAAAWALRNLAANNPSNKAAIKSAGAIPQLVRRLGSFDEDVVGPAYYIDEVVAAAAGALRNLSSGGMAFEVAIKAAGGLPALIKVLGSSNDVACEEARLALNRIDSSNCAVQAAATASIPALVRLLQSSNSDVLAAAASQLCSAAANHPANKAAIDRSGGILPLVALLQHDSSAVQRNAASAIRNLASESSIEPALRAAGAVRKLVALLSSSNESVLEAAAPALRNLAGGTPESQAAIKNDGGIQSLVRLVNSARGDVREEALKALRNLADGSSAIQLAVLAAGGWEAIVPLLGDARLARPASRAVKYLLEGGSAVLSAIREGGHLELLRKHLLLTSDEDTRTAVQSSLQSSGLCQQPGRPEDSSYQAAQKGMARLNLGAAASPVPPATPAPAAPAELAGGEIINWSDIRQEKKLGAGSYGEVWRASYCSMPVAVKTLRDADGSAAGLPAEVQKEAMLMARLRHPHVVTLMGVCLSPPALVMELCDTSLCDLLYEARRDRSKAEQLTWPRRVSMLVDAARGMTFLHHRNVVHRDLKSPNLLVDGSVTDRPRVKLADFGLSKLAEIRAASVASQRHSTAYNPLEINPRWLAPELASGAASASPATDAFAFGLVMWEVLAWELPWPRMNANQIAFALARRERPEIPSRSTLPGPRSGDWPRLNDYIALMKRCWAEEPSQRPAFTQVVDALQALLA